MPKLGKFGKLDYAKTEDKLKAFILFAGLLTLLVVGGFGAFSSTSDPKYCAVCHVMAPEYATWQASSHAQIKCIQCHSKPGLANRVLYKGETLKEIALYTTNTYKLPIKMNEQIEDQVCVSCHSQNRSITPSGDLIVPHDKHAAKKVACVVCHKGIAHGNIVARNMTAKSDSQVWTPAYAEKQMAKEFTQTKMDQCVECHIKRNVTQACEACHSAISIPQDHKDKTWGNSHGLKARADLTYCNKCHSYSIGANTVPVKDPVAKYARENIFCYDCHQKRPIGHTVNWDMVHKKDIVNRDVTNCLVCHDVSKQAASSKAVFTDCGKCHGDQYGAPAQSTDKNNTGSKGQTTFNKLHPPNWRKIHPGIVKEKGATNEGCWNCHDTEHCSACHMNKL